MVYMCDRRLKKLVLRSNIFSEKAGTRNGILHCAKDLSPLNEKSIVWTYLALNAAPHIACLSLAYPVSQLAQLQWAGLIKMSPFKRNPLENS